MPSTGARVTSVKVAERPGGIRPTEDRIFTTPNAAIVLDGASQPGSPARSGGWLAEVIGTRLRDGLAEAPRADLVGLLRSVIQAAARDFSLTPGQSPSCTVSMVRWNSEHIDVLALGDSPVIALTTDGKVTEIRDDRLSRVAEVEKKEFRESSALFGQDREEAWRKLVDAQRKVRNRSGGYWIVEADPEAAENAVRHTLQVTDVAAIMLMTDGVAHGVDRYRNPPDWWTAGRIALRDPAALVDLVHRTEESDPEGTRWRRSKKHDDKAIVVVKFQPTG
ncbi:hypothetical protein ACTI_31470 [Actinoplanes sp. OR16]|uniref:protein phosphatase 2C domain-containing protein n=1 Tax=Actinoplanes sp. OR16 TaxID=946334 RepID=UPI000F6D18B4|nr:protein phosphatase 2C domain-containing protein [Actinoplanes sp. OR16]BBH66462.1 hypothetical protein ACTI_31470 [Actinoplanes sp. OR16]